MISNRMSQTHNMTPNDLSQEQDMLLLAGSKVSYRDIYNREIELPSYKGKYYTVKDVDNLFVLFNGILTSVSEQAFRNNKALTEARENSAEAEQAKIQAEKSAKDLQTKLKSMNSIITSLKAELAESHGQRNDVDIAQLENVTKQLNEKSDAYTRLLQSSADKMGTQQQQISQLSNENAKLSEENENLKVQLNESTNQLQELTELASELSEKANVDTSNMVPKSEYELLQYKYDKLKKLSIQQINNLSVNA